MDAVQNARTEPAPARIVLLNIQRTRSKFKDALEDINGQAQTFGAGERHIELDATAARRSRKLDAREIFPDANLQIRKRLIILQVDVKTRLNILHQPGFHEQGVHVTVGNNEIDVGDQLDQIARAL